MTEEPNEAPERISVRVCIKCGALVVGLNACPHCGCDWLGTTTAYTRAASPLVEDDLIRLLLDWRKWYAEKMFAPWTLEEAQRVHAAFPGAVDRIAADSARGTIDNIIQDIRDGKLRATDPEGSES